MHASAPVDRGFSRRDFLKTSACALAAFSSGCATPGRRAAGPGYIDVHTHIFNGLDITLTAYAQNHIEHALAQRARAGKPLPLRGGKSGPADVAKLKRQLGRALAKQAGPLVRAGAANTAGELQYLRRYMRETPFARQSIEGFVDRCGRGASREHFTARYLDAQHHPVQYLPAAVREELRQLGGQAMPDGAGVNGELEDILRLALIDMWDFARRLCAFRTFNAYDLVQRYPQVDTFCALMVNFDAWMPPDDAARTTLEDQIEIMQRIAWISHGRILPVVSYDPLLHAGAANDGKLDEARGDAYFRTVRQAVEQRGFVGIKVYPPMGFRGFNNQERDRKDTPEPFPKCVIERCGTGTAIGRALDGALAKCYAWCTGAETPGGPVPVVAHCNYSNGNVLDGGADLSVCAHPRHWQTALKDYPDLHLDLGHFGGLYPSSSGDDNRDWMKLVCEWLKTDDASNRNLFVDVGHFTEVFDKQMADNFAKTLRCYLCQNRRLQERLLYGSDWYMPMASREERGYLRQWEATLDGIFEDHRAAMAVNALAWSPRISEARRRFSDDAAYPRSFA